MAIEERLEYTGEDAKEIFDRMQGTYSKTDILEGLKYLGANDEEGKRILEGYDKEKESKLVPKVKEVKPKRERSLESQIIKEELKKVGKGTLKWITYLLQNIVTYPTMVRKAAEFDTGDAGGLAIVGDTLELIAVTYFTYMLLLQENPKLIPYIATTQTATNIASGIYEYARHVKNKAKEKNEEIERIRLITLKQIKPKELDKNEEKRRYFFDEINNKKRNISQLELSKEEKAILYRGLHEKIMKWKEKNPNS